MSDDSSRETFDAAKHFSGVRLQKGRVQLDADYNEAVAILNHLAKQPKAQDTLEGIAQWWLLENRRAAAGWVKRLMDKLVRQGLVACARRPDGRTCYSLNRRKASVTRKRLRAVRKLKKKTA